MTRFNKTKLLVLLAILAGIHTTVGSFSRYSHQKWSIRKSFIQHQQSQVVASIGPDMGGFRNAINQFLAGAISGSVGLVVGHPFDTVKTRQQMAPPGEKISPLKVAGDLIVKEGPLAFFKGIHSPLLMTAFTNALAFAGYGESLRLLKPGSDGKPNKQYTYFQHFLAGAMSGALQAIAMSPTQLIKCKLQIQTGQKSEEGGDKYKGPIDCFFKVIQEEGIRGIFKGLLVTAYRDMWGFGVYYWCYQYLKNWMIDDLGMNVDVATMISGAATGVVAWVAEYPLDVIKTRIQCQPPEAPKEKLSITGTSVELWREGGVPAFFVGVWTSVARAIPVDAALFWSYEWSLKNVNLLEDMLFGEQESTYKPTSAH